MNINDMSFTTYGRSIVKNRIFPTKPTGINKLYYINSGSIICKTAAKEYTLKEGHLYLIPQPLEIILTAEYVDHTFFDFFTIPIIINTSIIDIEVSKYPIIEAALCALNLFVEKFPMRKITQRNAYYDFVKSSLGNLLFLISEEFKISTLNDAVINSAIDYIHHNYFNKISVTELAEKFHLEESSFIRRFKRYTNTTPYKYIKFLRVNIATSLIKAGNYTLSEIATMVGYSDAASLSHSISKSLSINYK